MKRRAFLRGLLGFPLGIFVGYTITILISLFFGDGISYISVDPQLIGEVGSEVGAVTLQFFLCGVLGAACAAGSVVWEMERWSLTKITVVHFLILSLSLLPISFAMHWLERSLKGVLLYFGVFLIIYACIWVGVYLCYRKKVQQINEKIQKGQSGTT